MSLYNSNDDRVWDNHAVEIRKMLSELKIFNIKKLHNIIAGSFIDTPTSKAYRLLIAPNEEIKNNDSINFCNYEKFIDANPNQYNTYYASSGGECIDYIFVSNTFFIRQLYVPPRDSYCLALGSFHVPFMCDVDIIGNEIYEYRNFGSDNDDDNDDDNEYEDESEIENENDIEDDEIDNNNYPSQISSIKSDNSYQQYYQAINYQFPYPQQNQPTTQPQNYQNNLLQPPTYQPQQYYSPLTTPTQPQYQNQPIQYQQYYQQNPPINQVQQQVQQPVQQPTQQYYQQNQPTPLIQQPTQNYQQNPPINQVQQPLQQQPQSQPQPYYQQNQIIPPTQQPQQYYQQNQITPQQPPQQNYQQSPPAPLIQQQPQSQLPPYYQQNQIIPLTQQNYSQNPQPFQPPPQQYSPLLIPPPQSQVPQNQQYYLSNSSSSTNSAYQNYPNYGTNQSNYQQGYSNAYNTPQYRNG